MNNIEETIQESIEDAELPLEEPSLEAAGDEVPELAPEPQTTDSEVVAEEPVAETAEVSSPASRTEDKKEDDFEKRFGVPALSATGRENRIPHPRVVKMVKKAETEAAETARKTYEPKLADYETKVKAYETQISDYDTRWTKVAAFENKLLNDVPGFLGDLLQFPQYAQVLAPLFQNAPQAPQEAAGTTNAPEVGEGRPEADQTLSDGSKVYSEEGLAKLLDWNASRAEARAVAKLTDAFDKRFGPIEKDYLAHQHMQEAIPQVQAQISEARKWHQFNENEADIVKALQADKSLTLEGAYNRVVVPKLVNAQTTATTDRALLEKELRDKILKELKTAPRATSTTTGGATRPNVTSGTSGKSSIEDVIKESIKASGLK